MVQWLIQMMYHNFLLKDWSASTFVPKQKKDKSSMAISKKEQNLLAQVDNIIIKNVMLSNFSIDFLARGLATSRTKFYQDIKEITGLTANQYVRAVRLKMAKEYLENGYYSTVTAVANQVGFRRVDYFSTLYKAEYGRMPSSYFK